MAGGVWGLVRGAVSAGQVFAEPIERDGTTLVGAARVYGGGGGELLTGDSSAGGVGLSAAPVGAYVIRDGQVRWIPAVDVNRVLVIVVLVLVVVMVRRARRRHRMAARESRSGDRPE
jgi:uncharacterized spore protein YtfJ